MDGCKQWSAPVMGLSQRIRDLASPPPLMATQKKEKCEKVMTDEPISLPGEHTKRL